MGLPVAMAGNESNCLFNKPVGAGLSGRESGIGIAAGRRSQADRRCQLCTYDRALAGVVSGHWPDGSAIELEDRDIQISVHGLMTAILPGVIPARTVAAIFASRGGKATSAVKRSSAQANGRKGGRPRKKPFSCQRSGKTRGTSRNDGKKDGGSG